MAEAKLLNELDQTCEYMSLIHTAVWLFRRSAKDVWKTPDVNDSYRYAALEAAEALEVITRINRPGDSRNVDKQVTILDYEYELADTAIMLVTALGRRWEPSLVLMPAKEELIVESVLYDCARAVMRSINSEYNRAHICGMWALQKVCVILGKDVVKVVELRLERIAEKNGISW